MSKKIISVLLLIGVLSTILVMFILSTTANAPENKESGVAKTETKAPIPNTQNEISSIESTEVAKHNIKNDCWTIIDGKVYDLTSYVSRHPGGSPILKACGVDGTALFQTRMNGKEKVGSGTPHSSSAQRQLEELQIGELSE